MPLPKVQLYKDGKYLRSNTLPCLMMTVGPIDPESDKNTKQRINALIADIYSKTADLDKCIIAIETSDNGYHHAHLSIVSKEIDNWNSNIGLPKKERQIFSGVKLTKAIIEKFRKCTIGCKGSVAAHYCPQDRLNPNQNFEDVARSYVLNPTKNKEVDPTPKIGVKMAFHPNPMPMPCGDIKKYRRAMKLYHVTEVLNHHKSILLGLTKEKNLFK